MKFMWPDDGEIAACPQCGGPLVVYQKMAICAVCARNEAKRLQKLVKELQTEPASVKQ